RREILSRYGAAMGSRARLVTTPSPSNSGHLAVLDCEDRSSAQAVLMASGVRTDIHYPIADHRQPIAVESGSSVSLPVTESAAARILSLPLFPELRGDEIDRVCKALGRL